MEYGDNNKTWERQGGNDYLQQDSDLSISDCTWDSGFLQHEDLSCMLEETTLIKACGDFHDHVNDSDSMNICQEYKETSSQLKRRRMLQFDNDTLDPAFQCQDISSLFFKSKERVDYVNDVLLDLSQWESELQEDISIDEFEGLDQAESWLADCLNDSEMFDSSEPNSSRISDVQNDHTDDCSATSIQSHTHAIAVEQQPVRGSRSIILKGKKAYLSSSGTATSSIAYPFTFIKPCGADGNVTLKDINQKIHAPPPKLELRNEDSVMSYPTSAFSGKPVVGKTRIRTEGGKGSITIMRTKG